MSYIKNLQNLSKICLIVPLRQRANNPLLLHTFYYVILKVILCESPLLTFCSRCSRVIVNHLNAYKNLMVNIYILLLHSTHFLSRYFTFFLRDLCRILPLGPVLLLPEGSGLGDGGLGLQRGWGFFSARFFWDATLLFSLRVNTLLSLVPPWMKSILCPLLMQSRRS